MRRTKLFPSAVIFALTSASLIACGESHVPIDGDAGMASVDAWTASTDAWLDPSVDAHRPDDAGADAGIVDLDGDGVPADRDCDDDDESVGETGMRECESACGVGTQSCSAGTWGACSAPTDCTCDTPGMMRTVACGRCGLASQRCEGGAWTMPSECLGERECLAGEIERDTAMCGERARICDDACNWRDWTVSTPPGECEAGATRTTDTTCDAGRTREETCSASCAWEVTGACELRCVRPRPTPTSGAEVVCIPAGSVVVGEPGTRRLYNPEVTVSISEFFVGLEPVSKTRYESCRSAGACPGPIAIFADEYDALLGDYAVSHIPFAGAVAFCAWDGGRLISEFQWTRAARGSAPDRRRYSWGVESDVDQCRRHPWTACPSHSFSVHAFPDAVSPFGVRLLGSHVEATSTPWAPGYAWVDESAIDPPEPAESDLHTTRGAPWRDRFAAPASLLERGSYRDLTFTTAFRCAY